MHRLAVVTAGFCALTACEGFPDLNLVDEIPIVGQNSCAPPREIDVGCVLDGDTFDITGCGDPAERVRLLGLDAPEIAHDGNPADCFGDQAGNELRRLIEGQTVTLTFDEECEGIFFRTLAYVYLSPDDLDVNEDEVSDVDGSILLNEVLLARGFAKLIPEERFGTLRLQAKLEAAQARAQANGLGLWGVCEPTQ